MKRKYLQNNVLLIVILLLSVAMKGDKPAYRLFKASGKETSYKDLLKQSLEADVVFFGEQHHNPICHWLQLELARDLHAAKGSAFLFGAEMFESDNQLLLNEYIGNVIKTRNFEDEAKLWPNYATDYKPLVEFARKNGIRFIATNIPRRYAALVNKGGFEALDSLDKMAKTLFPPLPVAYDPELKGYKELHSMDMGGTHVSANFPKAQAIKDATMAWFIRKNLPPGALMLHLNGSYHSENYVGIIWYLKKLDPSLKILSIATVEQVNTGELDSANIALADYILCVPESMTRTK